MFVVSAVKCWGLSNLNGFRLKNKLMNNGDAAVHYWQEKLELAPAATKTKLSGFFETDCARLSEWGSDKKL